MSPDPIFCYKGVVNFIRWVEAAPLIHPKHTGDFAYWYRLAPILQLPLDFGTGPLAPKLCGPLALADASRYSHPANPGDLLHHVYGDFTEGSLGGPLPTVYINTDDWVYLAAGHPVASIDKVYVDGVEQVLGIIGDPGVQAQVNCYDDYEYQGAVATITFAMEQDGVVTWRGKGKYTEVSGTLLVDPIAQLQDILLTLGDFRAEDFSQGTWAEAETATREKGYETAWVIADPRTAQDWMTEILFNVMGYWRVNGVPAIEIFVDKGTVLTSSMLVGSIVASRDCDDGDDGVEMLFDRRHLANKLDAFYQWNWAGDYASNAEHPEHTLSRNAHGDVTRSVDLRGVRDATMVATWSEALFARQAFQTKVEGAVVQFIVLGPTLFHATIGDLTAFTWPYGPIREAGYPYVNEILRIISIQHDQRQGGRSRVVAVDTGQFVSLIADLDAEVEFDAELYFSGDRVLDPVAPGV